MQLCIVSGGILLSVFLSLCQGLNVQKWEDEGFGINMIIPSEPPAARHFMDILASTPSPTTSTTSTLSCLSCPTAVPTCKPACKPEYQVCQVTGNTCTACASAQCVTKPGCLECGGLTEESLQCNCQPGQLCQIIPRTCQSCASVACIDPPPSQPCLFCEAPYQCIVSPDPECFGTTQCKNLMACLDPKVDCVQCQNQPVPECYCNNPRQCFYVPQTCDYCGYYDCKNDCVKCPSSTPKCPCRNQRSCIFQPRSCTTCAQYYCEPDCTQCDPTPPVCGCADQRQCVLRPRTCFSCPYYECLINLKQAELLQEHKSQDTNSTEYQEPRETCKNFSRLTGGKLQDHCTCGIFDCSSHASMQPLRTGHNSLHLYDSHASSSTIISVLQKHTNMV